MYAWYAFGTPPSRESDGRLNVTLGIMMDAPVCRSVPHTPVAEPICVPSQLCGNVTPPSQDHRMPKTIDMRDSANGNVKPVHGVATLPVVQSICTVTATKPTGTARVGVVRVPFGNDVTGTVATVVVVVTYVN